MSKVKFFPFPFEGNTGRLIEYTGYKPNDPRIPNKMMDTQTKQWVKEPREPDPGGWSYVNGHANFDEAVQKFHKELPIYEERVANGRYIEVPSIVWGPNQIFRAAMRIKGSARGRSSVKFNFVDELTGLNHSFFVSGMFNLLKYGEMKDSCILGTFKYSKRGTNYGTEIIKDD